MVARQLEPACRLGVVNLCSTGVTGRRPAGPTYSHAEPLWGPVRLLHDDGIGHHKSPRDRIALGRAACDRVNAAGNGTGWRVVVSSGSRHGAAVLRETNALDEVVRPFATSVEAAAAALVARVKRSG